MMLDTGDDARTQVLGKMENTTGCIYGYKQRVTQPMT